MTEQTKRTEEFRFEGEEVWMKIKALVKAGNIRHLVFKNKDNKSIFSLTVTIAVIIAILAPQLVVIVILIALLAHFSVVVEKENRESPEQVSNL